jgi:hypothetical protein
MGDQKNNRKLLNTHAPPVSAPAAVPKGAGRPGRPGAFHAPAGARLRQPPKKLALLVPHLCNSFK